jgi:acyl carrier protein
LTGSERKLVIRTDTVLAVKDVLVATLGIGHRAEFIDESTELFGSMPELDSLAIVELVTVLEEDFGFEMDEADITGETFETVGTLAAYVDAHRT